MPSRNLDWQSEAACRDLDTEIFFPTGEADVAAAVAVCRVCPVRSACLEFALATRQHDGIWGGLTDVERRRVRRRRAAEQPAAAA